MGMAYFDALIAGRDEIEIEESLWRSRARKDDDLERYSEVERAALREIERLKTEGTYKAERARLAAKLPPRSPELVKLGERVQSGEFEPLQNFLAGLKSADPEQRARFQRLYEEGDFANKAPSETWHIISCLEPAKKAKGRPNAMPPWRHVVSYLDEMRLAVRAGASIPQAARDAAAMEGFAEQASRAKYFERLYRQRALLRK
ncbi:MAG: hypothetical protein COW54_05935 [Rhodobacteraceae bacterium CG17_big_fil_post_rev_8_21_14_2_50_63_15]|nr:MAG: hypothetical protein COW54_05935 [Rhodobacteraceae bacterium CG17_big_fil_post_rev_8_21_14_2_50_63_15]